MPTTIVYSWKYDEKSCSWKATQDQRGSEGRPAYTHIVTARYINALNLNILYILARIVFFPLKAPFSFRLVALRVLYPSSWLFPYIGPLPAAVSLMVTNHGVRVSPVADLMRVHVPLDLSRAARHATVRTKRDHALASSSYTRRQA